MNRKQRRAEKKAKALERKVSNHIVDRSVMRAELDRVLKTDPIVLQAIQEEARRANLAEAKKQDLDIMTLILFSLHRSEKYGRKRLLKYVSTLTELKDYYAGYYQDSDMFAMRKHLKEETGLDIEHLEEEVAKYVEENSNKG